MLELTSCLPVFISLASMVGGFAPSIDLPKTTTEPPPTTPDPATLPYFLHHVNSTNVTIVRGNTATLDCQVFRLRDRMVSWVRRRGDRILLLTFGSTTYHSDKRYTLDFEEPNNWKLVIQEAKEKDQGHYECQVSSHPPKIHKVFLSVYVPQLEIRDARGEKVTEKFYQAGSSIDLTCTGSLVSQDRLVWLREDGSAVVSGVHDGMSVEATPGPEGEQTSRLKVEEAATSHSGNYTCSSTHARPAVLRVHVLAGESSAAMQHSTSRAADPAVRRHLLTPLLWAVLLLLVILP
ncbi:zwei Ig domain protein zig-8-like [Penaeus vannamei]|uniref:zwei Ig domain protein zig-8-like n=1 Tax=Penaeus vannamei TaxID=6689 RepID=UPI00387F756B